MRRSLALVARLVSIGSLASLGSLAFACGEPPPRPVNEVIRPPPREDAEAPAVATVAPPPSATFTATPPPPPEQPPPPKEDDPWMSHRQIGPDAVVATMKPAAAKIDKCFKDGIKRDPTVEGEVRLRFIITHEGAVIDFKDDHSDIHDLEVVKCVGGVIKALKFPVQLSPGGAFGVYATHLSHAH